MSNRPFFSFIIPTHNRSNLLFETLESILTENSISLEVVVVDDGGTDNTASLIQTIKDSRITYLKTENMERGSARNTGLKESCGEYVIYFDSDDLLNPCLQQVHSFLQMNQYPDVVFGGIETITIEKKILDSRRMVGKRFAKEILRNNFLACGSVFLRRDIAITNLFSENRDLSGTEDWELWLRVFADHEFWEMPIVIFRQRQHIGRSLILADADRVRLRESSFVEAINKNWEFLLKRFSKQQLQLLIADRFTLIALYSVVSGYKKDALLHLLKSVHISKCVLWRKRFWAIIKKILM